jgi:microcystin-dependent protein
MATYPPPNFTEPLSVFNTINWESAITDDGIVITPAYLNANYLKFPVAQGLETLQAITVNGVADFNNTVSMSSTLTMDSATLANRQISATTYSIQGLTTGNIDGEIRLNGSSLDIINAKNSGTITNYVKDSAGNSLSRLTISSTSVNCIEPLSLTGATDLDRIINNVYYQFQDKTSLATFVAQIYGSSGALIFDNDVNSGSYSFSVNNSAGTQKTPLVFNALGLTITTDNPASSTASFSVIDSSSTNNFTVIPNVGGGLYNSATDANNILLLGTSNTVSSEILQLSSWSATNNYVKVRPTSVGMGAGGTSNTATSSVECDGTTVRIVPSLTFPDNSVQTTAFTGAVAGFLSGMIIQYGGTSAPSGFLFCDGSQVSTTTYAGLFAVIGTTYANFQTPTAGNFFLPDFRDRCPIGSTTTALTGNNLNGGNSSVVYNTMIYNGNKTLLANQLASHTHNLAWNSANYVDVVNTTNNTSTGGSSARAVNAASSAFPTTSGAPSNFFNFQSQGQYLPPVCSTNFIIKT